MTPALLDDLVRAAASEVLAARGLDPAVLPVDAGIGRPRAPGHGEYATTVAFRAGRATGVPPRELAGWLGEALVRRPEIAAAQVAGPGFVNLTMTPEGRAAVVADALARDEAPGRPVDLAPDPELVTAIGEDAARYAALCPGVDRTLLTRRVLENPVFRVQYAHARLASLARYAADLGVEPRPGPLGAPAEIALVGGLATARSGDPARIVGDLDALACAVLDLLDSCAVLPRGDEETTPLHRARLAAAAAARRALANGLGLLGISAPERI